MESYDPQTGGYKEGMNPYDTYHSWAGSQYKEKVRGALPPPCLNLTSLSAERDIVRQRLDPICSTRRLRLSQQYDEPTQSAFVRSRTSQVPSVCPFKHWTIPSERVPSFIQQPELTRS